MGNKYSLGKLSSYLDEVEKNTLYNHSLVFNSIVFYNKDNDLYYYFRFEVKLDLGMIMIDRFISENRNEEWLYDKTGILQLLKLYNGKYTYNNLFEIQKLKECFYIFADLFVKDRIFIKLLLACKKTTYKQYIDSLKNEEGETIQDYKRRILKELI